MPSPTPRVWLLVCCSLFWIFLVLLNLEVYRQLRAHDGVDRIELVTDLNDVRLPYTARPEMDVLVEAYPASDHRALLRQVMDSVRRVEPESTGPDAPALLAHVRQGGGAVCSGMALLYYHALRLHGFEARMIALRRNVFEAFDTHQTVEVELEGRWVLFDPTFHVSFEQAGRLLGARDIERALRTGETAAIRPVFHGETAYPARLEDYYLHWLPLFNNVLVYEPPSSPGILGKLPLFRHWFGPTVWAEAAPGKNEHFLFRRRMYDVFVLWLPAFELVLGGFCTGLAVFVFWSRRCRESTVSVQSSSAGSASDSGGPRR